MEIDFTSRARRPDAPELSLSEKIEVLRTAGLSELRIQRMLLRRQLDVDYGMPMEVRAHHLHSN